MSEQREMKEKNPWHTPVSVLVAAIGVIAIIALVTVAVVQNKPLPDKYKYGIVLDAGSSHTALYIYEWPAEKDNNTGRVTQRDSCKVKGPGISSYASRPWNAGESLRDCMQKAQHLVPSNRHSQTPLYLGATAGMRLLHMENSSASDHVLQAVEEALKNYPFSFKGARILSGQEEGAFGWVTVNYLDDRLSQGLVTTGALDLGGASTQISFVSPNYDGSDSPSNLVTFQLYGNDYNLYTHSYLCYGKDQVLLLSLAHQTQAQPSTLSDPCFHPGYTNMRNYSDLYNSPCVSDRKPQIAPSAFSHSGTGDFAQCQQAFSAYYYVMNFLNLTDTSVPLDTVKDRLTSYCATPWQQLLKLYPETKPKYLAEYCFAGTYILTLLSEGYHLTADNYRNIKFVEKIKDSDAGWTLGYMLNLTNMIPAEAPDLPPLPHPGYLTIMTLTGLLLAFIFLFTLYWLLGPRCSRQPQIV